MFASLWLSWAWAGPLPESASEPLPDAGTLVLEAHVPAEILIDGVKLAQLYWPGDARFRIESGKHTLRIYVSGQPTDFPIELGTDQELRVLAGRSGVTLAQPGLPPADDEAVAEPTVAAVPVEFRCVGQGAQVRVGKERVVIEAGDSVALSLSPGQHQISLRNQAGTAIWASGTLEVAAEEGLVVQVTEGRLPELFGPGRFHASGG